MAYEFMYLSAERQKQCASMRRAMDKHIAAIADTPAEINDADNMACIRLWHEGAHAVGDVRMYEGGPYKCIQAHDSTGNPGWNPAATPALWMQYHGTTKETARPFIHPTGAHDMYLKGEYMVWTDGSIKRAMMDTSFSPDEYSAAWEDAE